MTNVTPTSINTYYGEVKFKVAPDQGLLLLKVMEMRDDWTNKELANYTGIDASTISARMNDVLKDHVRLVGKRVCKVTGRLAQAHALLAPHQMRFF